MRDELTPSTASPPSATTAKPVTRKLAAPSQKWQQRGPLYTPSSAAKIAAVDAECDDRVARAKAVVTARQTPEETPLGRCQAANKRLHREIDSLRTNLLLSEKEVEKLGAKLARVGEERDEAAALVSAKTEEDAAIAAGDEVVALKARAEAAEKENAALKAQMEADAVNHGKELEEARCAGKKEGEAVSSALVASLTEEMGGKDAMIAALEEAGKKRDEKIAELEVKQSMQDERLAKLEEQSEEKDRRIAELESVGRQIYQDKQGEVSYLCDKKSQYKDTAKGLGDEVSGSDDSDDGSSDAGAAEDGSAADHDDADGDETTPAQAEDVDPNKDAGDEANELLDLSDDVDEEESANKSSSRSDGVQEEDPKTDVGATNEQVDANNFRDSALGASVNVASPSSGPLVDDGYSFLGAGSQNPVPTPVDNEPSMAPYAAPLLFGNGTNPGGFGRDSDRLQNVPAEGVGNALPACPIDQGQPVATASPLGPILFNGSTSSGGLGQDLIRPQNVPAESDSNVLLACAVGQDEPVATANPFGPFPFGGNTNLGGSGQDLNMGQYVPAESTSSIVPAHSIDQDQPMDTIMSPFSVGPILSDDSTNPRWLGRDLNMGEAVPEESASNGLPACSVDQGQPIDTASADSAGSIISGDSIRGFGQDLDMGEYVPEESGSNVLPAYSIDQGQPMDTVSPFSTGTFRHPSQFAPPVTVPSYRPSIVQPSVPSVPATPSGSQTRKRHGPFIICDSDDDFDDDTANEVNKVPVPSPVLTDDVPMASDPLTDEDHDSDDDDMFVDALDGVPTAGMAQKVNRPPYSLGRPGALEPSEASSKLARDLNEIINEGKNEPAAPAQPIPNIENASDESTIEGKKKVVEWERPLSSVGNALDDIINEGRNEPAASSQPISGIEDALNQLTIGGEKDPVVSTRRMPCVADALRAMIREDMKRSTESAGAPKQPVSRGVRPQRGMRRQNGAQHARHGPSGPARPAVGPASRRTGDVAHNPGRSAVSKRGPANTTRPQQRYASHGAALARAMQESLRREAAKNAATATKEKDIEALVLRRLQSRGGGGNDSRDRTRRDGAPPPETDPYKRDRELQEKKRLEQRKR